MDRMNISVLMIEDNPKYIKQISQMLEESISSFIRVVPVNKLNKALNMLKKDKFDILLLDINLTDSSGLSDIVRIKENFKEIPIMVLTDIDDESKGETIQKFADDYLVKKDINTNLLVRSMRYAIERKKTEETLKASEISLKRSQEIAHLGSWELDIVNNILTWSDEVYRIFGLQSQEFEASYEAFLESVHPDDRKAVDLAYSESLKEGKDTYQVEHRIIRKSTGEIRYVHEKGEHIRDESGRIVLSVGMVQDITERKQAEEALLNERNFSNMIIQTTGGLIIGLDIEGRIQIFNNTCEEITGYRFAEVKGKIFWDFLLIPEEKEPVKTVFKGLKDGSVTAEMEFENYWVTKDGRKRFIKWANSALRDEKGILKLIIGTGIDITERWQAEKELRQSEEKYRELVENANSIILKFDMNGKIIFFNEYAQKFFGYSLDEIIGKDVMILVPKKESSGRNLRNLKDDIIKNPDDYLTNINENIRKKGELVWISWNNKPIKDSNGNIIGNLAVGQDITSRMLWEKERELLLSLAQHKQDELATLIENIVDEVWFCDNNGNITLVNAAARKFRNEIGLNPLQSQEIINIFNLDGTPDSWDSLALHSSLKGETITNKEEIIVNKTTGKSYYRQVSSAPIRDKTGNVLGAVAVVRDISNRKMIEQELIDTRNYLNKLINYANAPIIVWNPEFKVTMFNHAFEHLTGYKNTEIIGKNLNILFPMNSKEESLIKIKRTLAGEYWEVVEIPILCKDGSIKIALWNSANVYAEDGKTLMATIAQGQDITERKKKEEELNKLNRTLKALSHSSLALTLTENELSYLNEVCGIVIEDCGYSMVWIGYKEDDEAKTVKPVAYAGFEEGYLEKLNVTWDDKERGRGPTGTAIRTGKISVCRNMLTDPAFKPWRQEAIKRGYASSIVFPLLDKGKSFGAINIYSKNADAYSGDEIKLLSELADDLANGIIVIRSRIARKQAEEILRRDKETFEKLVNERTQELLNIQVELEKAKRLSDIGTLATTIAHELRNPLGVILIACENIKRKAKNDSLNKHLINIEKKITDCNQIINNLLYYSKIKTPNYESINIYNILNECIDTTKQRFKKNILFKKRFNILQDIIIEADPLHINEVFSNILNNACDAVADLEGKIEISAKNYNDYIEIFIKDNGIGIHENDLKNIFNPFFTTKAKGTGLGLSVCYQIIDLYRGSINIESKLNKGTTVKLSLPKKRKIKL